jgi:flagellar protein FliJ
MDSTGFTTTAADLDTGMRRRKTSQIGALVAEMKLSIRNLDADILAEEQRTRISDPANVAYSTLAMAARQRRDNLRQTVAGLEQQLAALRPADPAAEAGHEANGMGHAA